LLGGKFAIPLLVDGKREIPVIGMHVGIDHRHVVVIITGLLYCLEASVAMSYPRQD